jgi:signal transduction histidine kinase
VRVTALVLLIVVAALTSERADWEPVSLVVALSAVTVVADVAVFTSRRLRVSGGLMVQSTMMALLGAAPAVAAGVLATGVESRYNHVRRPAALANLLVAAALGLVGGALFETLGARFGLDREDSAYALLVLPVYAVLIALNLVLIVGLHPDLAGADRRRMFRESGLPGLPFELVYGILASVAVLAWPRAGLAVAAGLLAVQLLTIPLARTLSEALRSDDRASEVARLSSDRDRLLSEVLLAESRERARLAESLHDGPMQRLAAMRQDVAEGRASAADLDQAMAETRAIISAFHPATVRELGFEAALRAAVAPFPAARSIVLRIDVGTEDRGPAGTLLLPIAQELVVNAVKHASPTAIDVAVKRRDGHLVLDVSDDGVGIDTVQAGRAVQAGHVGLAMVRRRVEDAGGSLEIETRDDGGTRSRVTLPEKPKGPGLNA